MATDELIETAPAQPAEPSVPPAAKPMRYWPMAVMLAIFWVFSIGNYWMELSQGQRFISRLIMHAILFLGFFGWWMMQRSIRFRDRLLAVAVFVVGSAVMLRVADPTIGIMAIFLSGAPIIFTGWLAALYLTRHSRPQWRRVAVAAVILVVISYFALVRWDGVDGAQRSELSWRWSPTSEDVFLAAHSAEHSSVANGESATPWTLQPGDVPGFRGANRDGIVRGTKLSRDWTTAPPKQIWRQRLGPAWSSLIVVDGHVVTHEQRGESEVVACYDADTGAEVWVHEVPARFEEGLSGPGPRGTPTFDGGRVYSLGGKGNFNCIDAASGKLLWTHDLVAEAGAVVPQWGFSMSPLVVDGKVIVFAPGKEASGLLAYDAASGALQWQAASGSSDTYSSPQLVELDGVRQILMHDSGGLRAVGVDDGKLLWEHAAGEAAMPMLQPNVVGPNQLLMPVEPGVALLDVKRTDGKWEVSEVWSSNRLKPSFNDFIAHNGTIYGLDDGILCALDLATGERLWKKGRYGHGQILLVADQDLLVVQGARGEVVLVGIGGDQPEEFGRFEAIEGKSWNHPALVANRLYVRNGEEIACYELSAEN